MPAGRDRESHRPRCEDGEQVSGDGRLPPRPPAKRVFPSKLDPYKAQIDRWLADGGGTWCKQHHAARRIHDRLSQEVPGHDCSYSTVQRCVKERRRTAGERAFLELTWHPGESQAEFINTRLIAYCKREGVTFTRNRP